ncbi:MAG: YIP1 family protein [Actinobacteria bacterium]|nr:YIP1 family protein [Actinomycetota bacterium]
MKDFLGTLIHPRDTFQKIIESEHKPFGGAFLIVVFSNFIKAFIYLTTQPFIYLDPNPVLKGMLFVPSSIISGLVGWILLVFILHTGAKIFKGKGELVNVMVITAYAQVPVFFLILVLPLANISLLSPPQLIEILTSFTVVVSQLIVFVWTVVLIIIGLEAVYKFDSKKATAVFFLPGCGCAVLIITLITTIAGMGILMLTALLNK